MSDDSFFREVEEELRSEKLQSFWDRFGKYLIALAVAIVVGVGRYNYYEYAKQTEAAASGDAFMAAVDLAQEGKSDEALSKLEELEQEAGPAYRALARLRAASELAQKGDKKAAAAEFDAVVADNAVDQNLRSIARLRAGYLMVDIGTLNDVQTRVTPLTGPTGPYRFSAQEILGLAHFKAGDLQKSFDQFAELSRSPDVPSAMRQRIGVMLGVIAARGGPVFDADAVTPAVEG
ncbi:MAG: tetratricopeptide repeat protein [Pseudomonadota bacterium]